jgi:type III pantothenate kinase
MNPTSFLLVDAGNTRVKWALVEIGGAEPLRVFGEMPTPEVTLERVRNLAEDFPQHYLVLASVVPKLVPIFCQPFKRRLHLVTADSRALDLQFDYPKPSELGADRIAAAAAIKAEGLYPAIIVACGTATAFTVLNAKGRLCGGAIAPGLQAQMTAMVGATAQLPTTDLRMPRSALAKSTADAIRAGVMLGFQGGVREIIAQLIEALPGKAKPHLILTGGNAGHIAMNLELPFKLRPLLVLEGLRMIGDRTWKNPARK